MAVINKRIHKRVLDKKKKLDTYRPLPPSLVKRLKQQMCIEYTYNSNAIEGNTLSLHETRLVIEEGMTISGKSIQEVLEAKNHPKAIEFIEELVKKNHEIKEDEVLLLHKLIMTNIIDEAGVYRTTRVTIGGAVFTPPPSSEIKDKITKLLNWLKKNPNLPTKYVLVIYQMI